MAEIAILQQATSFLGHELVVSYVSSWTIWLNKDGGKLVGNIKNKAKLSLAFDRAWQ